MFNPRLEQQNPEGRLHSEVRARLFPHITRILVLVPECGSAV